MPHALIREVLEARMTGTTVELFHRGKRVASHARSAVRNRHTTIAEHMPSSHRRYAEWTPARIDRESERIGVAASGLCAAIMHAKPHPEQGFRACLGILRLTKSYGSERLEAACRRGLDIGATTYGSIASPGRYQSESVPTFVRNRWPASSESALPVSFKSVGNWFSARYVRSSEVRSC